MSVSLKYIGANGNELDLLHNEFFHLTHMDGLTEYASEIGAATTPNMDGDTVNTVRAQPRGIVLDMRVKDTASVEQAKRYIMRTIKPKQKGRLVFLKDDRETEIEGVVEAISMPRFEEDGVTMQVTLYCSLPYWQDVEDVLLEISRIIAMHYFPIDTGGLAFPAEGIPLGEYDMNMTRTYTNDGDAECGLVITIIALAEAQNPTIYKADGSFIGVNDTMSAGDKIIINTNRGKKSITKNGVNILNKIKAGSKFFQLETGDNELTVDTDGDTKGSVYFIVSFKRRFV